MIIHLIGSMREFDKDLSIMNTIANAIEASGRSIALNWVAGVHDRKTRGTTLEDSLNWDEIVEGNVSAAINADALIVEGSHFNYSQGYQTAIALGQKKPVLNLYRKDLPEYKEWPDKFFVSGISDPLFTSVAYNSEEDLQKIVTNFMERHTKKTHELDIKLALEDDLYAKIEKRAQEEGKGKAGIIKDLISQNFQEEETASS